MALRKVSNALKNTEPLELPSQETDFSGNRLHEKEGDKVLRTLMMPPRDEQLFITMMKNCLDANFAVVEKQFAKYFRSTVTEEIVKVTKSARCHNIDAEEVMGMYRQQRTSPPMLPSAFLSSAEASGGRKGGREKGRERERERERERRGYAEDHGRGEENEAFAICLQNGPQKPRGTGFVKMTEKSAYRASRAVR